MKHILKSNLTRSSLEADGPQLGDLIGDAVGGIAVGLRAILQNQVTSSKNQAVSTEPVPVKAVDKTTASKLLGCSEKQISRLLRSGELIAVPKRGRHAMILLESIYALQTPAQQKPKCVGVVKPKRPATTVNADELTAAVRKLRI